MNKSLVATLLLAVGIASAQASVIYKWQPVSQSPDFETTGGSIAFTDQAWSLGGSIEHRPYTRQGEPYDSPDKSSHIRTVRMNFSTYPRFYLAPNPTDGHITHSPWALGYGLTFNTDGTLSGSLKANDSEDDFEMASPDDSSLFEFSRFGSDGPGGANGACHFEPQCVGDTGATGHWVLDQTSVPSDPATDVPTPASLYWLGFALLALGLWRRSRCQLTPLVKHHFALGVCAVEMRAFPKWK